MAPTYLRVVITSACTLACDYCHLEGDPATENARGLSAADLLVLLHAALDNGIRKLKFLGGEPLLRKELPEIIADLRARDPHLDISLITGGAVSPKRLDACFEAGLSRANLSIHGWSQAAFVQRTKRGAAAFRQRQAILQRLLDRGRKLKLNYVWTGPQDDADLAGLLEWAADKAVVVSALDDLGNPTIGPKDVEAALIRLRGPALVRNADDDPHSLPTLHLQWADGLVAEIKDHHLGELAPWRPCATCPKRAQCGEGIHALRLTHDGRLRPCMDRPDVGLDLSSFLTDRAPQDISRIWQSTVRCWVSPASSPMNTEIAA